ncbi:hypothetical protein ACIRRA_30645 [Nocardia sp. NPDC101769]|uniref:PGAP1-like alpha/beta domain-containing protein n=1 Tax=Nocardia sp. NPDC101769 TaxID=3364333 RepID=UPI0038007C0F
MVLKHLIVQLPGIGGSVLARDGRPVWDLAAAKIARAVCAPDVVSLDGDDLEPVGLVDTMTVIPGLVAVSGYDGMIANLRRWFGPQLTVVDYLDGVPIPAQTDVLRMPYDFRRSVTVAAQRLDRALAGTEAAQRGVVVLAHSMGGLVARSWVADFGGGKMCRALITLGTPFRGAPKALDVLVNGLRLGGLRHPGATRVIREWPGAHELLPQYPAVQITDRVCEPTDLAPELVRAAGDAGAGARFVARAREAAGVHDRMTALWQESEVPELVPFYSRGHATPHWAGVAGGRLRVTAEDPSWRGNVGWFGDGTVPMVSAIPPELSELPGRWHPVLEKHGDMGATAGVRDLLTALLGGTVPRRGGDSPDRPWLGLDLEDVVWTGSEHTIAAEVFGTEGPGTAASVTVAGVRVPMVMRGNRWEAMLPDLPAGVHEVVVEARDPDDGAPVWGQARLVVAAPGDGWEPETDADPETGVAVS